MNPENEDDDEGEQIECEECGGEVFQYTRDCANGRIFTCEACGHENLFAHQWFADGEDEEDADD